MVMVAAAAEQKRSYDLPRGEAATMLARFAEQSGRPVLFAMDKVRGARTNAVVGEFSPAEALDRLLAGTELIATFDRTTGDIVVSRRPSPAPPGGRDSAPPKTTPTRTVPETKIMPTVSPLRRATAWLALLATQVATAQTVPASGQPTDESPVQLSPFLVSTAKDRGYEANETLSGTRLSTPSSFVGAAITDVTPALMQDLALTDMQDLINFVPNSAAYFGGGVGNDPTGNGAIFGITYYVRGNAVSSASRDFIKYRVYEDAYNVERFSFNRGPNSILFGIGDAAGIVNSVSKRAQYKDSYSVAFRVDSNDSARATFDLNKQILPRFLAVRLAGLHEDRETNRKPSDRKADRLYGALTANPFRSSTLRISYEKGRYNALNVRPWPAADGLTPWIQAGRQEIPAQFLNGGVTNATSSTGLTSAVIGNPPQPPGIVAAPASGYRATLAAAGFEIYRIYPIAGLRFSGSAPLELPPINANGFILPIKPFQYGTTTERNPTLINSPIPYTANVLGYGNGIMQDFNNRMFSLEQAIGRDVFVEVLYSRQHIDAVNNYSSQNVDNIYIDKNPTLLGLDGVIRPNPKYNQYFLMTAESTNGEQRYIDETARATASYKLDCKRYARGRLAEWLGYHNFAGLLEKNTTDFVSNNAFLLNTDYGLMSRVPQFPVAATRNVQSANNRIPVINYIDPQRPETWNFPDLYPLYPHILYDGSPRPAPGPDGLAPAWVAQSSTRSFQEIRSRMLVMQNVFLNERMISTFGWRHDVRRLWSPPPAATNPATGYVKNILDTPAKSVTPDRKEGSTRTQGLVAFPVRWLGLSYNQSTSFQPVTGTPDRDIFGNFLPNSEGKGKDYGIKFSLLEGRINGSVTRFNTTTHNIASILLRNVGNPVGSMDQDRTQIRTTMQRLLPDDPQWLDTSYPWNAVHRNLNDNESKGYEFSVTANPLRNWRLTGNVSTQRTMASNVGVLERRWLVYARAIFAPGGKYAGYDSAIDTSGISIASHLDSLEALLTRAKSLEGRADARQPRKMARMTTAYDFIAGPLKNWGVGATYRWSEALVVGYPYISGSPGLFDPNRPYFGDAATDLGVFVSYRFKVFTRYNCRLQLNVDNVLNDDDLHPIVKVDRGDGQPIVSRYSLGSGRNLVLSGSIEF